MVNRLQFFEFFYGGGSLRSKKVLPMQFEFVDGDRIESMARDAGFHVLDLFGNHDRSAFDAGRSPVMISVPRKMNAQPPAAADTPRAAHP